MTDPSTNTRTKSANPTISDQEAAESLRQDAELLKTVLEKQTNRSSRWNGVIQIDDLQRLEQQKAFAILIPRASEETEITKGEILCQPFLFHRKIRWHTLTHELCHALSRPVTQMDLQTNLGWEEGTVECLKRALFPQITQEVAALGEKIDTDLIARIEQEWPYQTYARAMQTLFDLSKKEDAVQFFSELAQIPLAERMEFILRNTPAENQRLALMQTPILRTILPGKRESSVQYKMDIEATDEE